MRTQTERRLRDLVVATRAVQTNLALPGRFAAGGVEVAFAIGNRHAERDAGWARVCHRTVAEDSGLDCKHLRLLVRAMVGDRLIERREGWAQPTSAGYRTAISLRSLVGGQIVDLLRALTIWTPDWSQYVKRQAPRPRRSHVCPHCGCTGVQIVTSCMGCGVVLSERIVEAGALVHGDGEPPG